MSVNEKERVVVAMSGGVDSSVAAALLVEQGYEVIGMMMRLWSEEAMGGRRYNRCCTPDQMADARRIANQLGIPFYVLDTREIFREKIVEFFVEQHRRGVTPNPCLECNRHIRFDFLLTHALALNADYLATGHYARIARDDEGRYLLKKGVDESKDQSYVLSVMGQEQLRRARFPVGEHPKPVVREIAERLGLPTAGKKDSQDLCFIGDGNYRRFLTDHAPDIMQPGPIVLKSGEIVGEHTGLANYTIGQRKGLGVQASAPLYVLAMNPYRNALVVGPQEELGQITLTANRVNWVRGAAPKEPFRAEVKIRYRARAMAALVEPLGTDRFRARFEQPLRDITPGQGAVVYDGDICLGGGIIERASQAEADLSQRANSRRQAI